MVKKLTGTPLYCLSTRSYVNWPSIYFRVRVFKRISFIKFRGVPSTFFSPCTRRPPKPCAGLHVNWSLWLLKHSKFFLNINLQKYSLFKTFRNKLDHDIPRYSEIVNNGNNTSGPCAWLLVNWSLWLLRPHVFYIFLKENLPIIKSENLLGYQKYLESSYSEKHRISYQLYITSALYNRRHFLLLTKEAEGLPTTKLWYKCSLWNIQYYKWSCLKILSSYLLHIITRRCSPVKGCLLFRTRASGQPILWFLEEIVYNQ